MRTLETISWVLVLAGIVVIAACGQASHIYSPGQVAGPQGEAGLAGLAGTSCEASCESKKYLLLSCGEAELRVRVTDCEVL